MEGKDKDDNPSVSLRLTAQPINRHAIFFLQSKKNNSGRRPYTGEALGAWVRGKKTLLILS